MPIVSGFVVPKMNPTSNVGNIILLLPVVMSIKRKEDNQAENDDTKDAEEPKESLSIMPKIAAIIFLVSFTNCLPFISKHGIDFTDMHLHLRDQVQDSNTDLDTQLRHSDTDLDTDHDTFVEDHDTIHSYHDTNHDTKRVPLTNKQKDIVNFCSVPRTSREILERAGVVYHTKNIAKYITSLVAAGYLQMTNPDNPTASNQKYKKVNRR